MGDFYGPILLGYISSATARPCLRGSHDSSTYEARHNTNTATLSTSVVPLSGSPCHGPMHPESEVEMVGGLSQRNPAKTSLENRVPHRVGHGSPSEELFFGFTLVAAIVFPAVWYVRRGMLRTQAHDAKAQPLREDASRASLAEEEEAHT